MMLIMASLLPWALMVSGMSAGEPAPPGVPPGYKLVWQDEFNGAVDSPPNPRFWNHETGSGGYGNQELQNYVKDGEHAKVVADSKATDGKALQIQVTSEAPGKYTSARLQTAGKVTFQFGYIEGRLKLPYGQGIWPAFWMLGMDIFTPGVGWPKCGEIDIMENIGKKEWWGRNEGSLHGPGYSGADSLHEFTTLPDGKFFKDDYHTFSILWEKDRIAFFVDGKKYQTRTPADIPGKTWAFNHPFFFIVNLAVGGNFPGSPDETTTFPQKYLIDYIRVYQKPKDAKNTKLPSGGNAETGAGINNIVIHGED